MRAPSAIYEQIGRGYASHRRADPRINAAILDALGDARSILNVGAGPGSYEPADRSVVSVEPALAMIRQRTAAMAPVIRASATRLPFREDSFDAAMAVLTVHHWRERRTGLREVARVSRGRVVILTWDPSHDGFWLVRDYFSDMLALDRKIFPPLDEFQDVFGAVSIYPVPIPHNCVDGFLGAYWRRPHVYLDPGARSAISSFSRVENVEGRLKSLHADLRSGDWQRKNADLLDRDELDIGYRLVVAPSHSSVVHAGRGNS